MWRDTVAFGFPESLFYPSVTLPSTTVSVAFTTVIFVHFQRAALFREPVQIHQDVQNSGLAQIAKP